MNATDSKRIEKLRTDLTKLLKTPQHSSQQQNKIREEIFQIESKQAKKQQQKRLKAVQQVQQLTKSPLLSQSVLEFLTNFIDKNRPQGKLFQEDTLGELQKVFAHHVRQKSLIKVLRTCLEKGYKITNINLDGGLLNLTVLNEEKNTVRNIIFEKDVLHVTLPVTYQNLHQFL